MPSVTSVINSASSPGSPVSRGKTNMAAAMKRRMTPNRGSESCDLDVVAVDLTLAAVARKRRGKQLKDKYFRLISNHASKDAERHWDVNLILFPVMPVSSFLSFPGCFSRPARAPKAMADNSVTS